MIVAAKKTLYEYSPSLPKPLDASLVRANFCKAKVDLSHPLWLTALRLGNNGEFPYNILGPNTLKATSPNS